MTSSEHVIKVLDELVKVFPDIRVLYEHQKATETHVIKIEPEEILNDAAFQACEEEITFDFIELYPWENIYFARQGSYTTIHHIQHSFEGVNYVDENLFGIGRYSNFEESDYDNVLAYVVQAEPVYSIDEISTLTFTDVHVELLETFESVQLSDMNIVTSISVENNEIWKHFVAHERGFNTSMVDNAGESNYAIAA